MNEKEKKKTSHVSFAPDRKEKCRSFTCDLTCVTAFFFGFSSIIENVFRGNEFQCL